MTKQLLCKQRRIGPLQRINLQTIIWVLYPIKKAGSGTIIPVRDPTFQKFRIRVIRSNPDPQQGSQELAKIILNGWKTLYRTYHSDEEIVVEVIGFKGRGFPMCIRRVDFHLVFRLVENTIRSSYIKKSRD